MNATAARDFTFKAERGGVSLEIPVHFAYAEVLVSIAGGNFEPVTPTSNNTAVVGQKIEAKIEVDPFLTVQAVDGFEWNWSVSDNAILNYLTTASEGRVIEHTFADLHNETFEFYNPYGNATSVGCDFSVSWPGSNGLVNTRGLSEGAGINFVKPEATLSGTIQTGVNMQSDYIDSKLRYMLYMCEFSDPAIPGAGKAGIKYDASITTPQQTGGTIAFLQLIHCTIKSEGGRESMNISTNEYYLDVNFPYDSHTEETSAEKHVNANTTEPLVNFDSPKIGFWADVMPTYFEREDFFKTYFIYKPDGTDSIWVPLQMFTWTWKGRADYNTYWHQMNNNSPAPTASESTSQFSLPEWTKTFVLVGD